jgi:uncharacterized protein (DUF1501 family)
MNPSRRNFLKKLPVAVSLPFTIAGIPINLMAENPLTKMARASFSNDRVLIILQMHGGNDGLNMLIPVDAYEQYYSKRANIAIPAKNSIRKYIPVDSTLDLTKQIGFHPDMQAMKNMYDQGRVAIVQGVSYKHNNGSHFRGRDIMFMGGSADDYYESGWVGRYLTQEIAPQKYPEDFPNTAMPDPLAIEMGSDISLIFHQETSIPTSISINNPETFAELVGELEGFEDEQVDPRGIPPLNLQNSPYYNELEWILSLEDKSKDYAARMLEVYQKGGAPSVTYPEKYPFNAPGYSLNNPLTRQLQMVARMMAGGCKTKVFLLQIGGFDTHADQAEKYDPTMGSHAALMYHISSAMNSFQQDLRARGLEDRVLTITTSEFGRRVHSNGSYGTDHGTAGPVMIFGKGVKPGVHGDAFNVTQDGNNLGMQYDYRTVYSNIVKDWLLAGESEAIQNEKLNGIFPGLMTAEGTPNDNVKFEELPIVSSVITGNEDFIGDRFALEDCAPNPANDKTTVHFKINNTNHVSVNLINNQGKNVMVMVDDVYTPGSHKVEVDLSSMPAGNYIYQFKSGFYKDSKKLSIIR